VVAHLVSSVLVLSFPFIPQREHWCAVCVAFANPPKKRGEHCRYRYRLYILTHTHTRTRKLPWGCEMVANWRIAASILCAVVCVGIWFTAGDSQRRLMTTARHAFPYRGSGSPAPMTGGGLGVEFGSSASSSWVSDDIRSNGSSEGAMIGTARTKNLSTMFLKGTAANPLIQEVTFRSTHGHPVCVQHVAHLMHQQPWRRVFRVALLLANESVAVPATLAHLTRQPISVRPYSPQMQDVEVVYRTKLTWSDRRSSTSSPTRGGAGTTRSATDAAVMNDNTTVLLAYNDYHLYHMWNDVVMMFGLWMVHPEQALDHPVHRTKRQVIVVVRKDLPSKHWDPSLLTVLPMGSEELVPRLSDDAGNVGDGRWHCYDGGAMFATPGWVIPTALRRFAPGYLRNQATSWLKQRLFAALDHIVLEAYSSIRRMLTTGVNASVLKPPAPVFPFMTNARNRSLTWSLSSLWEVQQGEGRLVHADDRRPRLMVVRRYGTREVLNLDVLIRVAQGLDYRVMVVQLEHLPFTQQYALIRGTDVLMSSHGMQLAWAPAMRPGTPQCNRTIVELRHFGRLLHVPQNHIQCLSYDQNISYIGVPARSVKFTENNAKNPAKARKQLLSEASPLRYTAFWNQKTTYSPDIVRDELRRLRGQLTTCWKDHFAWG